MKISVCRFAAFSLILVILISSPQFLSAQYKFVGELTVTKTSPEGFVTINGERAISGRSIASTSEIVTSPLASAKVTLAQTGTILLSPGTKLILSFVDSSISGDLNYGEITIETAPNTSINLLTADGAVTLPNQNQANVFKAAVENKRTRIQTLTGAVNFNNVLVSAGEFYPLATNEQTKPDKSAAADSSNSRSFNPLLIVGILGAVAAVAVIALSASSNNNASTVSPTR